MKQVIFEWQVKNNFWQFSAAVVRVQRLGPIAGLAPIMCEVGPAASPAVQQLSNMSPQLVFPTSPRCYSRVVSYVYLFPSWLQDTVNVRKRSNCGSAAIMPEHPDFVLILFTMPIFLAKYRVQQPKLQ